MRKTYNIFKIIIFLKKDFHIQYILNIYLMILSIRILKLNYNYSYNLKDNSEINNIYIKKI